MPDFTPVPALAGGALIGLAASVLLIANGRVAGISGIVTGLLLRTPGDVAWRALFVGGLLLAGLAGVAWWPGSVTQAPRSLPVLALAGLLVGLGTRLARGCTSGHGVCGVSRLSARSVVATLTFVGTGMATVLLVRTLGGVP